jgi:WD40 repeat protein
LAESRPSTLQLEWQDQLTDLVTAIAWSPTGESWAASSANGEIVWRSGDRTVQPTQMLVLQAADGRSIDRLAFSADARWLAAGGQSGKLRIWDCQRQDLPPQLFQTIELSTWIGELTWHPHLPQLAIGYGSQVKLWNAATAHEISTQTFAKSAVFDLAWHPSGEYLAIAGYKGVEIWDTTERNAPNCQLAVDTASIQIAWSPDGRYLAAGNLDRSLTIMDWHHPTDPWILQGCPGKIRHLAWLHHSPNPCLSVATGAAVVLWELATDEWTGQLLEGHQGVVVAIAACLDRAMLISAATDGHACVWSAQGEISQIITSPLGGFTALAWHPDYPQLITGTEDGAIGLWQSSA